MARDQRKKLEPWDLGAIMTRDADRTLSRTNRVKCANSFTDAIFISIHFYSGGRGRAEGSETLTPSPTGVAHYGRGLRPDESTPRQGNTQDSANIALATAVHRTCPCLGLIMSLKWLKWTHEANELSKGGRIALHGPRSRFDPPRRFRL